MRYATPARREWEGWEAPSAAIVAMGLALAVAGIVQSLETSVSQPILAFELFVSLLVPTGLATGGYWLASRNVSPDRRWRAAIRVSIGIVVACGLAAWLTVYVSLEGGAIRDPLSLTTTLAAVGGTTGFVTAVREPSTAASAASRDHGIDSRTDSPAIPTEPSAPVESDETAVTDEPAMRETVPADESVETERAGNSTEPESPMERPTAAAAATAAIGRSIDAVATPASSTTGASAMADGSETEETTDGPSTPETIDAAGTAAESPSSPIWRDADPVGRTAAPARPARPEPTATEDRICDAVDVPVRDANAVDASPATDATDDTVASRDPLDAPTPAQDPGVDAVTDVSSAAETVLGVLQRDRARIALAVLYHEWEGEERSVDALARAVSYHVDADSDAVETGLRHATLPELREIRAVDWDPYTERVAAPEHAVFEEGVREASVLLESFEPGTR